MSRSKRPRMGRRSRRSQAARHMKVASRPLPLPMPFDHEPLSSIASSPSSSSGLPIPKTRDLRERERERERIHSRNCRTSDASPPEAPEAGGLLLD